MDEENNRPEKDNGMNPQEQREFIRRVIQEVVEAGGNPEVIARDMRKQERLERIAQRKIDREERKAKERKDVDQKPPIKIDLSPIHEQAKKDRETQNKNPATKDEGVGIPERDRNEQERKLSGMGFAPPESKDPLPVGFRPKEFLFSVVGGGGSGTHMWKAVLTGASGGFPKFSVKGGIVVVQGTRVEVADVAELIATSETGYICLKVVRDSASQAYDAGTPAAIVWEETDPTSTYEAEFTVLAEYLTGSVAQCRSHEICSYEKVIVALGEFKLLSVQANSRNVFDLPP